MQKKHHIILYGLLSLSLILAVAYAWEAERETRRYARAMEETYQGTLLAALSQMERLRLNIDKALVSADEGQSAQLISRISSDAAAVQGGLAALPLSHAAMGDAVKLCNQLSDYAQSLLTQADSALSDGDAALLSQLSAACDSLLQALQKAYGQMRTGKIRFGLMENSLADADRAARPIEGAADGIDYPTLIYDGPFSDIVSEGAPKGLGTGQIDPAQAVRLAADFVGESEQNAAFMQESGGPIPAYCVRVTRPDCVLQLAVTRQGGDILWMFPENAGFTARYGLEESKRAAQQFFSAHGYGEMRLTFWQMYGGMATLSYAAVQQGVVLYPDLIKLQVRLDTLEVVGLEARRYLSSHAPRQHLTPSVSREEAEGAVSERLSLRESQLCVIPLNRQEYLCWEFVGEYNNQTYFVYIDALNGRQRDIQRLVEGSNGPKAE